MKNRIKAPVTAVAAIVALSGCGLLDVDNPNSLVEESIRLEAAANGVANGALQLASEAVANVWQVPQIVSDDLYWIGSRDAFGQLDNGFISNAENEFTDVFFPPLGRGVWMAQNAVEILAEHRANNPGGAFEKDYGRSLMFRGLIMMVTAELQQDMTFSYKMEDGPPVSSGNATIGSEGQIPVPTMLAVMDLAISSLTEAIGVFNGLGESDLEIDATGLRARAYMSRAIMGARNSPNASSTLAYPSAVVDANTVLAAEGGNDWAYNFSYSEASNSCSMCQWINDRKENQIDLSLVTVDAANDIDGISMNDPVSGAPDLALIGRLEQWNGGDFDDPGDRYPDLTITSERLMELIVAENDLATGGGGVGSDFEEAINNIRDLDGEVPFVADGAIISDLDMLKHTRRVNTLLMALRLQDMYRWDIRPGTDSAPSARWASSSDAILRPGTMLPITIIEIRANCYLATPPTC